MDCKEAETLFSGLIDNELARDEKMGLKKHLSICPKCSQTLKALQKSVALVKGLKEVEAPVEILAKVKEEIAYEPFLRRLVDFLFSPAYIKAPIWTFASASFIFLFLYVTGQISVSKKMSVPPSLSLEKKILLEESEMVKKEVFPPTPILRDRIVTLPKEKPPEKSKKGEMAIQDEKIESSLPLEELGEKPFKEDKKGKKMAMIQEEKGLVMPKNDLFFLDVKGTYSLGSFTVKLKNAYFEIKEVYLIYDKSYKGIEEEMEERREELRKIVIKHLEKPFEAKAKINSILKEGQIEEVDIKNK